HHRSEPGHLDPVPVGSRGGHGQDDHRDEGRTVTMKRRVFSAGLVAAPFVKSASAQPWAPSGPIKMIVAYPAGGPTDVSARTVAADLAGPLGQQVIVENLSGAAGAIGTRTVAKAKPDGLTVTFGNNQTHGNNMFMLKDPGYDAIKDFAALAGAGAFEHV